MPRSDERSIPKGWIRGNTKIGPVLEVKVTYHLYQHGIEIKVDSMKNGSQSWIEFSRRMNKYVNELPEENCRIGQKQAHATKQAFQAASVGSRAPPQRDGTSLQQTATWPGPPKVNDMKVHKQGREAAPETRRSATRPAQRSAMGRDHLELLPESDAVYLRAPRDRWIVKPMISYLPWKKQNVFAEEEELETCIYIYVCIYEN